MDSNTVIMAIVVLGALGIVFGGILAIASKVFAVEKDPREEAIAGCLPGANCGGCGYPGCGGYATAVVKGIAPINACAPGGAEVAAQIGAIMGQEVEEGTKRIAEVFCTGKGCDKLRYDYEGLKDCRAMSRVSSGPLMCTYGCLAGGTCEEVCPFDAIHVIDGVAVVDKDACVACGKCVDVCPRHIIHLVPLKTKKHVVIPCSSKDKGVDVRKSCDNGCIGCGLCVKACPKDAIVMEDNLAKIDYDKCIGCGICAQKCPRKLITVDGKVPEPKPEKPKAAPAAKAAPAGDAAAAAKPATAKADGTAAEAPAAKTEATPKVEAETKAEAASKAEVAPKTETASTVEAAPKAEAASKEEVAPKAEAPKEKAASKAAPKAEAKDTKQEKK